MTVLILDSNYLKIEYNDKIDEQHSININERNINQIS
jgi:hypothetical protein